MKPTVAIILFSSLSLIGQAVAQCQTYTVQSGDYCSGIAAQFNINPWNLLLQWNPSLDSSCDIYPGQVLCVSDGGSTPTTSATSPSPTSGGAIHQGDVAKYNPYGSGTLGACGFNVDDWSYNAVSVSQEYFTAANPNLDPLCNTMLTIVSQDGTTIQAKIVDKKVISPPDWSLDLNAVAYNALGGNYQSPGNIPLQYYQFDSFSTLPNTIYKGPVNGTHNKPTHNKPTHNKPTPSKSQPHGKKEHGKAKKPHTKGRKANL
ncbi:hypothetical protein BC937DRAFT_86963 [Endogone sp. FLAS-F59071]|nr:hypothetical protein BC937DRAFT_86963 [Endogone sp. FLAS-F59071]|eukprot:RUS19758.1 hypothetical protein BC937DRAFT_86963 [Endogone sp. FLAS-F59071]